MLIGIAVAGWLVPAQAVTVDSEIVLLVDITRPELSQQEFSRLMDGYATAFSSASILDSIQSGAHGRIAVSMMFFGDANLQTVGIPWMMIENASQAQQFADLARSMTAPMSMVDSNVGAALTAAAASFGTETGGVSNGFESALQVIEVASTRVPQAADAAATAAAGRSVALNSGVDLINALVIGNKTAALDAFYTANVIGSTLEGVAATTSSSRLNGTLAPTMTTLFTESVQTMSTVSFTSVPEIMHLCGLIPATVILLRRRRA
jgi:hypothetical protein